MSRYANCAKSVLLDSHNMTLCVNSALCVLMRFWFAHDEKMRVDFLPFPIFPVRGQTKNALLVRVSFPGFVALA